MNIEDTIKNKRKFDLENRLIDFAIRISELAEAGKKLFNDHRLEDDEKSKQNP